MGFMPKAGIPENLNFFSVTFSEKFKFLKVHISKSTSRYEADIFNIVLTHQKDHLVKMI